MNTLIEFFKNIGDIISSCFQFLIGMIQDLVYMVGLLGKFIASLPSYLSWLPGSFVTIILTIFGVVVIYKILGREG